MKPIDFNNLLVPKMLRLYGEMQEKWPVTEAEVSLALSSAVSFTPAEEMWRHLLKSPLNLAATMMATLCRTATLFLVDYEELHDIIASDTPPPVFDLPPLPYPRIAVECWDDAQLPGFQSSNGLAVDVILFHEIRQGEQWQLWVMFGAGEEGRKPMQEQLAEYQLGLRDISQVGIGEDGAPAAICVPMMIYADGRVESLAALGLKDDLQNGVDPDDYVVEMNEESAGFVKRTAFEIAHLITARGVNVNPLAVPRPRRREFQRNQQRYVFPQVYYVDLAGAHEERDGASDRHYHCRWMVRGHWRQLGTHRTWVRPYIKGPAGAPWKGRPIYVTSGAREAQEVA